MSLFYIFLFICIFCIFFFCKLQIIKNKDTYCFFWFFSDFLALPSYRRWRRCSVRDNDQSLIGNILGIATDILGRALCQRPVCNDASGQMKNLNGTEGCFTLVPKKVKIGQNKVLALFNEPLEKNDDIKITIENSGEIVEVTNIKQRNPYTIQFSVPGWFSF